MSGGCFDYAYCRVNSFVEELDDRINSNESFEFKPETIKQLIAIKELAHKASKLMKEAEWLYSYDTSEESFLLRIDAIYKSMEKI